MLRTARGGAQGKEGKEFVATEASAFLKDFTFRRFLEDCYAENVRRMSVVDASLLRPAFLPRLADIALAGLRWWSGRRQSA
jgi:hypothetical protein